MEPFIIMSDYVHMTNISKWPPFSPTIAKIEHNKCASDVNDLSYVTGSVPQDGSALNLRYHVFDTIKL